MDNYFLISIVLTFLLLISLFYISILLFWKHLKIKDIAEIYTTIGIEDVQSMKLFNGVPGIWVQYVGNKCWNVCKTRDIGNEMQLDARRIKVALNNSLKSDKRLRNEYKYQGNVAIKYRNLVKYAVRKHKKIKFTIILTNISDDNLLEFYEMEFAVKNKAIAWAPAPGKQTKIYYDWKKNGGDIKKYKKKYVSL